MMTILLEGQNLSVSTPHIVAGTKDYLSVEIIRGTGWSGLHLHVFFKQGATIYELLTDGNRIGPEAHINLTEGKWSVSVSGYEYDGDQLVMKITSNSIGLNVAAAPPESGSDLPYIPASSIEQIAAIAQSVRDDADAGVFNGEKGDKGDKGDPGDPPTDAQILSAVDEWFDENPTEVKNDIIADQYSSSSTYDIGDYVFYGGALYRCIKSITTAESWTSSKWKAVSIGADIEDLRQANRSYNGDVAYNYSKWAANLYLKDTNGTVSKASSNISEKVVSIPITGGKRYTIIAGCVTTLRAGSGTVEKPAKGDTTNAYVTNDGLTDRLVIEPPAGDTYLYVQCWATGDAVESLDTHLRDLHVYPTIDTNLLDGVQSHKLYEGRDIVEINHRGYHTVAPENTIPAFRLSVENGYKWIECDVHLTSDNVPVILHDDSINRTARNPDGTSISGTVNIGSITYEDALYYDFGIWKDVAYAGTKIPTLEEVLNFARCTGVNVAIELKSTCYDSDKFPIIYNAIKKYAMQDYVEIFGDEQGKMMGVARMVKNMRLGWSDKSSNPSLNAKTLTNIKRLGVNNNIVFFHTDPHTDSTLAGYLSDMNEAGISIIFRAHTDEQIANAPTYAHMFITNALHPKTSLYNTAMGN